MMKVGISRVFTLVEKGKIGSENASQQGKEQPDFMKIKKDFPFVNKIRVNSVKGEPVNVNLPINLIKAAMQIHD
jgi:hypothetical protein